MTFFPKHQVKGFIFNERKPGKRTHYYDALTKKLLAYLFRHERIPKSMINSKKLIHQGAAILANIVERDLEGKRSRLEKVVTQFCKIKPDKYTPVIWNITDFWMKFYQIEKWLEKREEFICNGRITQPAKEIFKNLLEHHPNKHIRGMLLNCIQQSINNYKDLITILKIIAKREQRFSSEAKYWMEFYLGTAEFCSDVIEDWFKWLIPNEKKWAEWEPSPFQLTFSIESSQLYKFLAYPIINSEHRQDVYAMIKEIRLENRKLRRQGRESNPYRNGCE